MPSDHTIGVIGFISIPIGLTLSIIGIWLTIHARHKPLQGKLLTVSYSYGIPLAFPIEGIEVKYEGRVIQHLSQWHVLLWNRGSVPIEASDFISPISIASSASGVWVRVHRKDAAAGISVREDKKIQVDLLRPGEAAVLQIRTDGQPDTIDVQINMKSVSMIKEVRRVPFEFLSALGAFSVTFGPMVLGIVLGPLFHLSAWIIVILVLCSIGWMIYWSSRSLEIQARLYRMLTGHLSRVALRFFKFKDSSQQAQYYSSLISSLAAEPASDKK